MSVPDSYEGPVYIARCRGCSSLHEVTRFAAEEYNEKGFCRIICRSCGPKNHRTRADIEYRPEDLDVVS